MAMKNGEDAARLVEPDHLAIADGRDGDDRHEQGVEYRGVLHAPQLGIPQGR
jgi:hypothetical protein